MLFALTFLISNQPISNQNLKENRMFSILKILAIVFTFIISGCMQSDPGAQTIQVASTEEVKPAQEESMNNITKYPYKGTIHYMNLEGGFFGIVTDKGEKLLPFGLEKKYFVEGTVIMFSGNHEKGMMTIQQWGTPFRIDQVQLISLGKNKQNPEA